MSRLEIRHSAVPFVLTALVLLFVNCVLVTQPGNKPQQLDTPYYPSVAAGGESDTVTWDPVAGATSYMLFYTTDGHDPTTSSASITISGETTYVHTNLDPSLTYTYAVQAAGRGVVSDLSSSSWGVQPLPMIHATITFNDWAYGDVGLIYFQVDGSYLPINTTKKTVPATTNAFGSAFFDVAVDHDNYWAYAAFKDMDGDGTLSAGDTVWGNNTATGRYGYIYWSSTFTSSKTFTKSFDSNSTFDSLPHVF